MRFKNPQTAERAWSARGTQLADELPARSGSAATSRCSRRVNHLLVTDGDAGWRRLDHDVHRRAHERIRRVRAPIAGRSTGTRFAAATGFDRRRRRARSPSACGRRSASSSAGRWGSPSTRNSVATIREVVNCSCCGGNIGRPGAGVCPVRGHSNVQGDRTMGIYERPVGRRSSTRSADEFAFEPPRGARPRHRRHDPRRCATATVTVFIGMGGNFASATPDTAATHAALRTLRASPCRCRRSSTAPTSSPATRR